MPYNSRVMLMWAKLNLQVESQKPKALHLKLEMLKLDSKENIEKYHYLPLTYFDRIEINFGNLQADKFDIACTILKSIFEQKDNNCELVIDLVTVTLNGLIDLLNLFPITWFFGNDILISGLKRMFQLMGKQQSIFASRVNAKLPSHQSMRCVTGLLKRWNLRR